MRISSKYLYPWLLVIFLGVVVAAAVYGPPMSNSAQSDLSLQDFLERKEACLASGGKPQAMYREWFDKRIAAGLHCEVDGVNFTIDKQN